LRVTAVTELCHRGCRACTLALVLSDVNAPNNLRHQRG
jgi:hypothetical protein